MAWTDEPATETQLSHLRQFCYEPDHPLTKGEASRLISDFEADPNGRSTLVENDTPELTKLSAHHFRVAVERAKRAVAEAAAEEMQNPQHVLALAIAERQDFWVDTCSDTEKMHLVPTQVSALYKRYGCQFALPRHEQVQAILDVLDSAMPLWDRDYPELFYATLELNFPESVRHWRQKFAP